MKTYGLKLSLLFGIMAPFFVVHGLPFNARGSVLVEHGDKMGLSPCVPRCGWFNRTKFIHCKE